jgi:internalin A
MEKILHLTRSFLLGVLTAAGCAVAVAQEVFIPDPGLNAAVREALPKPNGPLTEQDLLGLTNLNASSRNISNIVGLDAARNLVSLNLQINHLTNVSLPDTLTNLLVLDLSSNSLTHWY